MSPYLLFKHLHGDMNNLMLSSSARGSSYDTSTGSVPTVPGLGVISSSRKEWVARVRMLNVFLRLRRKPYEVLYKVGVFLGVFRFVRQMKFLIKGEIRYIPRIFLWHLCCMRAPRLVELTAGDIGTAVSFLTRCLRIFIGKASHTPSSLPPQPPLRATAPHNTSTHKDTLIRPSTTVNGAPFTLLSAIGIRIKSHCCSFVFMVRQMGMKGA